MKPKIAMDEELEALRRQLAAIQSGFNKLAGDRVQLLFKDFALEYLKNKLANPTLRQSTKDSFENQTARHLIPRLGHLPIEKVTNAEWLYWVSEEQNKPEGIRRFFNARKTLIEILRTARDEGHIEKLPKFDNPDEKKDTGRALKQSEVVSILWHSRKPFRFIFYTFWKMGCRPREILRWEWAMMKLRPDSGLWIDIPARISKTGRNRSIPINPQVSKLLVKRLDKIKSTSPKFVFPSRETPTKPQLSYSSAWLRACLKGGVDAMPYDLRRTFITRSAAEGKPLIYVAKLLDTSISQIEGTYAKAQALVLEDIVK